MLAAGEALTIPAIQIRRDPMTVMLGSGEWTFEVEESWAKIPDEIVLVNRH